MKKTKTIILILSLSAILTLVAPVMAIGPWQAFDKNPLLTVEGNILNLAAPSGVSPRWHNTDPNVNPYRSRDFTLYRPASKADATGEFKNTAMVLMIWDGPVYSGSVSAYTAALRSWISTWIFTKLASKSSSALALEYENQWIYMSSDYVRGMWCLGFYQAGKTLPEALAMAGYYADVLWPNGVYYKYNNVGQ